MRSPGEEGGKLGNSEQLFGGKLLKERSFVEKTGINFKKEVIGSVRFQDVNVFCSLC